MSTTYRGRWLTAVSIAVATVLMIAGCGASTSPKPDVEASVDRDAGFTFGYNEPATSLDPHVGTSAQDVPWMLPVYDTLLHYAPDGTLSPGLAQNWELSEDEFRITLRPELTFHDGAALDAAAVVANFERAKTLPTSAIQGDLASVESAAAVDDLTVVYRLSSADASVPATFGDRAGMMISPTAFTDGTNLDTTMIGAGGWTQESYSPGDELVTTRFDDYWDAESAAVQTLTIRTIADDDTRLNALRSGEIDMARLVPGQVALAEADSSLTVQTDTPIAIDHLGLNIAIEPFDDPLVREAIQHAIDREALIEGLYRNVGTAAWQPFPRSDYFAFDPDLENIYPYNPERSRELLTEAGFPDGFSFDFYTNNQPFRVQATEAIAAMLADVGIEASIIPLDGPTLLDEYYYQKTVPLYFTPWGGRADPSITLDNLVGPDGLNNPAGVATEELAQLLDKSRSESDPEARAELLRETSREIMDDSRMIPIASPAIAIAFRPYVVGYEPPLTAHRFDFLGVGVTDDLG